MARHYLLGNRADRREGGGRQGRARGERPAKRKQANGLGVIEHD